MTEPVIDVAAEPVFTWRVHLAARRPRRSAVAGMSLVVVAGAVAWLYGSPLYGLIALIVLFGSTATYWLPKWYAVYRDRLEVKVAPGLKPIRYPLTRYRACFRDGSALFLSPTAGTRGLARFRGLTLFLSEDADAVAEFVGACIGTESARDGCTKSEPNRSDGRPDSGRRGGDSAG